MGNEQKAENFVRLAEKRMSKDYGKLAVWVTSISTSTLRNRFKQW